MLGLCKVYTCNCVVFAASMTRIFSVADFLTKDEMSSQVFTASERLAVSCFPFLMCSTNLQQKLSGGPGWGLPMELLCDEQALISPC